MLYDNINVALKKSSTVVYLQDIYIIFTGLTLCVTALDEVDERVSVFVSSEKVFKTLFFFGLHKAERC